MDELETDPIIDEVRAAREAFAKENDYDIDAMVHALQEESARHGRELVTLPPRRPEDDDIRDAS